MNENEIHTVCYTRENIAELTAGVKRIVDDTPIVDIHTHLYAPEFGTLLLWGIDELLTYHYLIAEVLRASDMPYDTFWKLDKTEQADFIWKTLFLDNIPYSEGCRGVLTALDKLGLDVSARDLNVYREWFHSQSLEEHLTRVFELARIESVIMTNDPFDTAENIVWKKQLQYDARFKAALRIDPLLNDWETSHSQLSSWGYDVSRDLSTETLSEVRRFLQDWIRTMDAQYMAVSLPPDFTWPEESARATLISKAIMPVAEECNIPFAMMIGVKRQVNPALKGAGDGVGTASLDSVEHLCATFPKNKFMVTMLARENQHALCVAARKFRNLLVFGCWWFLNNPSLIEEMTRMRLELLGPVVIPQHSDARILEQVLYKWSHSREIIAKVLSDKYGDIINTGWKITEKEIRRDVSHLLGGNLQRFKEIVL